MPFQDELNTIRWRLHLSSAPDLIYKALSTDAGRAGFWAESAVEQDGFILFVFPNKVTWKGQILAAIPSNQFAVRYYGGSVATFNLRDDGLGGTDLTLTDSGVSDEFRSEVIAGWVSVLMALKGAVDFGIDLRNHDYKRTWDHGYVEN